MCLFVIPVNSDDSEEASIVRLMSSKYLDCLGATSIDTYGLLSKRILIYCYQVFVLKDLETLVGHSIQVASNN